jgi:hypothetical protein
MEGGEGGEEDVVSLSYGVGSLRSLTSLEGLVFVASELVEGNLYFYIVYSKLELGPLNSLFSGAQSKRYRRRLKMQDNIYKPHSCHARWFRNLTHLFYKILSIPRYWICKVECNVPLSETNPILQKAECQACPDSPDIRSSNCLVHTSPRSP